MGKLQKTALNPEILFISRNYPPKTGGLEIYSYHLIRAFAAKHKVEKIVLSKGRWHLIWFFPWALFKALWIQIVHGRIPVHLCDGLLAPLGAVLKLLTRTRVTATLHGLDVTYANPLYQKLIPPCLAYLDQLVCVSRATMQEASRRGLADVKCTVIANGVNPDEIYNPELAAEGRLTLSQHIGRDIVDRRILLTVGRLVQRKGVVWFIENVMPILDPSWIYLVAGDGPELDRILSSIEISDLNDRVIFLGRVTDEERNLLLNTTDLFVMPNIKIKGDMEGFGIAAIEAGSCGVPVVASDLEGLKDAVIDGVSGYLVETENPSAFLKTIMRIDLKPEKVRAAVAEHYGWESIFRRYRQVLLPGEE